MWYGAPGSAAEQLESALKEQVPDLFAQEPDLIFKLVTLISPKLLRARGIPVCRTVQEAGEFVVTWPRAFHAGFNMGVRGSCENCISRCSVS